MIRFLVIVIALAVVLAWPISGVVDKWMWTYEPKGDEDAEG